MEEPVRDTPEQVITMFGRVATDYDRMNRLMTFGMDRRWRQWVVRWIAEQGGAPRRVLDLGAGTGEFSVVALAEFPSAEVFLLEPSEEMLKVAQEKMVGAVNNARVRFLAKRGDPIPFDDGQFDVVLAGFVLRNLPDLGEGLREIGRVLRPGGLMGALEVTVSKNWLRFPFKAYLRWVIPAMAKAVVGDTTAWRYLERSSSRFPGREALIERVVEAGLEVRTVRWMVPGGVLGLVAERTDMPQGQRGG